MKINRHGSEISNADITLADFDEFRNVRFVCCYFDDVSNAPFDGAVPVFYECKFEDCHWESGSFGGKREAKWEE